MMSDNDGQMIFGDLGGLRLHPTFVLQVRKNPEKKPHQETCPERGLNPDPLRDRRACCRLAHSGGRLNRHYIGRECACLEITQWEGARNIPLDNG